MTSNARESFTAATISLRCPMNSRTEFAASMQNGAFEYDLWAENGLPKVTPLWLLKYLPNMPASHIAIYNDLRGPSNSITMREASSNLALGEAARLIERGSADIIDSGSDRHSRPSFANAPRRHAGGTGARRGRPRHR